MKRSCGHVFGDLIHSISLIARCFGSPCEVLAIETASMPELAESEVLVRMIASPINPSDLIPVTGAYRHRTTLPFIPGYEGVGIVTAAGPGTEQSLLGRRVLPLGTSGCWQELKVHRPEACIEVPADIDDHTAATAYINPLTAILMLRDLAPQPGQRIAVSAARSAIGRMLVRMLAEQGVEPVALVRSSPSDDPLSDLGETIVEGTVLPRLDGGLDAVGGNVGAAMAAAIRPGGRLLHYGLLSGDPLTFAGQSDLRLFRLRDRVQSMSRMELSEALSECFEGIRAGTALTEIEATYPLAEYRRALRHDARPGRRGKILLTMSY